MAKTVTGTLKHVNSSVSGFLLQRQIFRIVCRRRGHDGALPVLAVSCLASSSVHWLFINL